MIKIDQPSFQQVALAHHITLKLTSEHVVHSRAAVNMSSSMAIWCQVKSHRLDAGPKDIETLTLIFRRVVKKLSFLWLIPKLYIWFPQFWSH